MSEESLGQKIRQARIKRKWSREVLAEKLGIASRTVLRWEIKGHLPNNANQQDLIDLLGLKEEDFQRKSEEEVVEEPIQETLASLNPLSELEQMLPPKEDFKMYSGRRIYRKDGKYMSKTTYVTVNGVPLKYFGRNKRNPEKETVFEWGYYGGGPSRLAEAILADYLGETYPEEPFVPSTIPNAILFGTLFKGDSIGRLPRAKEETDDDDWHITSYQIREWFYSLEEEGITRTVLLKDIGEE